MLNFSPATDEWDANSLATHVLKWSPQAPATVDPNDPIYAAMMAAAMAPSSSAAAAPAAQQPAAAVVAPAAAAPRASGGVSLRLAGPKAGRGRDVKALFGDDEEEDSKRRKLVRGIPSMLCFRYFNACCADNAAQFAVLWGGGTRRTANGATWAG